MEQLAKDSIRARVRLALDETGLNESESDIVLDGEEYDDAELDAITDGKMLEALRYVYSVADASLVPWSEKRVLVFSQVHTFDGFIEDAPVQSVGVLQVPEAIFFDAERGEFVARIGMLYYNVWTSLGSERYISPSSKDCFLDTTTGNYYVYSEGKLEEVTAPLFMDSTFVPGYQVVTASFSDSEVWRWHAAGLRSWKFLIACESAVEVSSPDFSMLSNPYTTGTVERPKVATSHTAAGVNILFFSASPDGDEVILYYIPSPSFSDDKLSVGEKLVDAFIYYLSGLVCQVLGDERQQGFFQQAAELMGRATEKQQ